MNGYTLQEHTQTLLRDPLLVGNSLDEKIQHLLREEYLRRLIQYRRMVSLLAQKYGMSFENFINEKIIERDNFSWHVETDAMDWEMAVSGIKTMERKLAFLQQAND